MKFIKPFFLTIFCIVSYLSLAQNKTISLQDIAASNNITMTANAQMGLGEDNLLLRLENKSGTNINVVSESGQKFKSKDPNAQDLLIVDEFSIELKKNEKVSIKVTGYCTQLHKYSPSADDIYKYEGRAEGTLGELSQLLLPIKNRSDRQSSIWMITDNYGTLTANSFYAKDSSEIEYYKNLASFLEINRSAKIKVVLGGQRIDYNRGEVFSFKGVLSYQVPQRQKYSFRTVDVNGEVVHNYFKDRTLNPGLKFYTFGINQIVEKNDEAIFFTELLDGNGNIIVKEEIKHDRILEAERPHKKNASIIFELKSGMGPGSLNVYKDNGDLLMEYRKFSKLSPGMYSFNIKIEYLGEVQKNLTAKVVEESGKVRYSKKIE